MHCVLQHIHGGKATIHVHSRDLRCIGAKVRNNMGTKLDDGELMRPLMDHARTIVGRFISGIDSDGVYNIALYVTDGRVVDIVYERRLVH